MPATPSANKIVRVLLELEGVVCAVLSRAGGGDLAASVVEEKLDPTHVVHKHLAGVAPEPIELAFDLNAGQPLFDWIAASWADAANARRDGAIVAVDAQGHEAARREFQHALITRTAFSKLDAASKDAFAVSLTLQAEATAWKSVQGKQAPPAPKPQKAPLASNFRLDLPPLTPTPLVALDAFAVEQPAVADAVGQARDVQLEPTATRFPNLVLAVPENAAQPWSGWFDAFTAGGAGAKELAGAVVLLSADMKTEVARVGLQGVGICAVRRAAFDPGSSGARRASVELYCEQMTLHVGGAHPLVEPVKPVVTPVKPVVRPGPRPVTPA